MGADSITSSSCKMITRVRMRADYKARPVVWISHHWWVRQLVLISWRRAQIYRSVRTNVMRLPFNHLISMWAREHSRLRVETGLRSVSSKQGSRNIRDTREHTDLGTATPDRLSDNRLVETTRYRVQVINSSMTWKKRNGVKRETFTSYIYCIFRV